MNKEPSVKETTIERNMVINGTHIHIKSVFSDKIPLEKALANIAQRKLANLNRDSKSK